MKPKLFARPNLLIPLLSGLGFIILSAAFTYGYELIETLNVRILVLTGDLEREQLIPEPPAPPDTERGSQPPPAKKRPRQRIRPGKYEQKTPAPEVAVIPAGTAPRWEELPRFPELRHYRLRHRARTQTDIRMACDGEKLFFFCNCRDGAPDELQTAYTAERGEEWISYDDGIELLLMRNRDSKCYLRYIVTAGAASAVYQYHLKPRIGAPAERKPLPAQMLRPLIECKRNAAGYAVTMEIALSNLGIDEFTPEKPFLIQVVRNYRGSVEAGGDCLQLFPTAVYIGRHAPPDRHRQYALMPVKYTLCR